MDGALVGMAKELRGYPSISKKKANGFITGKAESIGETEEMGNAPHAKTGGYTPLTTQDAACESNKRLFLFGEKHSPARY